MSSAGAFSGGTEGRRSRVTASALRDQLGVARIWVHLGDRIKIDETATTQIQNVRSAKSENEYTRVRES